MLHLVDVASGRARVLRDRMPKAVLRFAPDGRRLAAATRDGRVEFDAWLAVLATAVIDRDGRPTSPVP